MNEIAAFTPEQGYLLWQDYLKRTRTTKGSATAGPRPLGQQADYCVILDDALAFATDSKTGATSGQATICVWDVTAEEYTETETQITVWNHSESTAYSVDTFGVAMWIAGHWWFFGDCSAMAAR